MFTFASNPTGSPFVQDSVIEVSSVGGKPEFNRYVVPYTFRNGFLNSNFLKQIWYEHFVIASLILGLKGAMVVWLHQSLHRIGTAMEKS